MGTAKILFKSKLTMLCKQGDSLDDKETADGLLKEVVRTRGSLNSFVQCENGGGFDATEVIGITIPGADKGAIEVPEERR